jgi:hypothetical protein
LPATHEAPVLWAVSHATPQAPQLVIVLSGVSQPPVFGGVVTQSAHPGTHEYAHVVPLHVADPCVVSHTLLHPPQLDIELSDVSHPSASGAVVLQLKYPGWQTVYVQVVPLHAPPMLCSVSQTLPQPPQFAPATVSQPLVFAPVLSQSAKPVLQLV